MEQESIAAVVGSCSRLALRVTNLSAEFGRPKDRSHKVDRNVSTVFVRLNAIKVVVTQLAKRLQQSPSQHTFELLPEVSRVLHACAACLVTIGKDVEKAKNEAGPRANGGVVHFLDESTLVEYQNQLQTHVQALSVIVQCLQLQEPVDSKATREGTEAKTTIIHGTFELRPKRKDDQVMTDDFLLLSDDAEAAASSSKSASRRQIFAESGRQQSRESGKAAAGGVARSGSDPASDSDRRKYTTTSAEAQDSRQPYSDSDDDSLRRKKAGSFGLKILGRSSRRSALDFDKLSDPDVLLTWVQWHRQQRKRALEESKDLQGVLTSGLYTAVRTKQYDYLDELFESGARDVPRGRLGWTLMHHAVDFADEQTILHLLERRVDPNVAVEKYGNPLHYAAMNANEKVIQLLLENGANVNAMDLAERPPLYTALRYLLGVDHKNKQKDPKWPIGRLEATRASVCYQLRPGVRVVLLLLVHGAATVSEADMQRWHATVKQQMAKMRTNNLYDVINAIASPTGARTHELLLELYPWMQHALQDSLREAARGSVSHARPKTGNKSDKKVTFQNVSRPHYPSSSRHKSADAQRLEQLLGL